MTTDPPPTAPMPEPPQTLRVVLPLARPRLTYVLLGLVAATFVIQLLAGGSTNNTALVRVGAQVNSLVAQGEFWRLLAAMFLHIGLMHIAFNAWALFSLGRDVEAFYGTTRFAVIYFVAGLAGNIAYYLLGPDGLSAGASGAVFGLIGAETAFFLANRGLFGKFGRERLSNLAVLIGINLMFGFTVQGINNFAHLGGLVSGLLLGLALTPRYRIASAFTPAGPIRQLVDRQPAWLRIAAILLAIGLLVAGVLVGNQRWAGRPELLLDRAATAYDAGDLTAAQQLLERAVAADPTDPLALYNLGIVYLQQEQLTQAIETLEQARSLAPEDPGVLFALGAIYTDLGRAADARPLLEQFLRQETSGDRADAARRALAGLP